MRYPDYLVHYNKNHDKRTGRFTFGDGNGDGVSPDDYRTPELDASYNKYKTSINDSYGHEFSSGLKGPKGKSFDICVKALTNIGAISKDEASSDYIEQDIFDFFNGYQSVAYLARNGYDKSQIKDIIVSNHKFEEANKKSIDTYPYSNPYLESVYKSYYNNDKDSAEYKEIDKYIDECVKLSKEMEHSDMGYSSMDYSSYLVHFNTRHDPKTGRFDFALPNEKMKPYGGQKKSEFAKSLKTTYESEGNSSLKSSRLTKYAIKSNKNETQQYNNNLRAFDLHKKKALKAYDKQDQKKYDREITKMLSAYRYAKIHEVASNDSVELGKMLYKSVAKELADSFVFGGAIGGAIKGGLDAVDDNNKLVKYYKDANKKVKAQMNMDYITKHPKEALEKLQIDTELDKRFGY